MKTFAATMIMLTTCLVGCAGGGSIFGPRFATTSPDGTKYLQVDDLSSGTVDVCRVGTDEVIVSVRTLPPGSANDLKCTAWAPNSQVFCAMYHGGLRSGASLYDATTGAYLRTIAPDRGPNGDYLHQMVFSEDGTQLLVGYFGSTAAVAQYPTGL